MTCLMCRAKEDHVDSDECIEYLKEQLKKADPFVTVIEGLIPIDPDFMPRSSSTAASRTTGSSDQLEIDSSVSAHCAALTSNFISSHKIAFFGRTSGP